MKLTLIRLLLIAVFFLLAKYIFHNAEAIRIAFVLTYIFEPAISQKV